MAGHGGASGGELDDFDVNLFSGDSLFDEIQKMCGSNPNVKQVHSYSANEPCYESGVRIVPIKLLDESTRISVNTSDGGKFSHVKVIRSTNIPVEVNLKSSTTDLEDKPMNVQVANSIGYHSTRTNIGELPETDRNIRGKPVKVFSTCTDQPDGFNSSGRATSHRAHISIEPSSGSSHGDRESPTITFGHEPMVAPTLLDESNPFIIRSIPNPPLRRPCSAEYGKKVNKGCEGSVISSAELTVTDGKYESHETSDPWRRQQASTTKKEDEKLEKAAEVTLESKNSKEVNKDSPKPMLDKKPSFKMKFSNMKSSVLGKTGSSKSEATSNVTADDGKEKSKHIESQTTTESKAPQKEKTSDKKSFGIKFLSHKNKDSNKTADTKTNDSTTNARQDKESKSAHDAPKEPENVKIAEEKKPFKIKFPSLKGQKGSKGDKADNETSGKDATLAVKSKSSKSNSTNIKETLSAQTATNAEQQKQSSNQTDQRREGTIPEIPENKVTPKSFTLVEKDDKLPSLKEISPQLKKQGKSDRVFTKQRYETEQTSPIKVAGKLDIGQNVKDPVLPFGQGSSVDRNDKTKHIEKQPNASCKEPGIPSNKSLTDRRPDGIVSNNNKASVESSQEKNRDKKEHNIKDVKHTCKTETNKNVQQHKSLPSNDKETPAENVEKNLTDVKGNLEEIPSDKHLITKHDHKGSNINKTPEQKDNRIINDSTETINEELKSSESEGKQLFDNGSNQKDIDTLSLTNINDNMKDSNLDLKKDLNSSKNHLDSKSDALTVGPSENVKREKTPVLENKASIYKGDNPGSHKWAKEVLGFSDPQISAFLEAFSVFDKNADGVITLDELENVMRSLGQTPTPAELYGYIADMDEDGSGNIDFNEFLGMMSRQMHCDPETELQKVFRVFDENGDGLISVDELFSVMLKLGETITRDEAQEMIEEADIDNDGFVNFSEFKSILSAH